MARRGRKKAASPLSYRFGHVLLWVNDEQASFDFYSKVLGLDVLNDDNEKGLYTAGLPGGFEIAFHVKGKDEDGTGMTVDTTGTAKVHFDFDVPDADVAYATLVRRGVKFLHPPKDMPWGERHAWLLDPDGYIIGLSSPIHRRNMRAAAVHERS